MKTNPSHLALLMLVRYVATRFCLKIEIIIIIVVVLKNLKQQTNEDQRLLTSLGQPDPEEGVMNIGSERSQRQPKKKKNQ